MKPRPMLCLVLFLLSGACLAAKEETVSDIWDGAAGAPVPLYVRTPDEPCADPMPALVICPGGGYSMLCIEPEGFGIADWLNRNGIAGFVLEYRLPKGNKEVPLSDARRAVAWVRAHAAQYHVDPEKIGIIGFSAGGHLASSAAVHCAPDAGAAADAVPSRPDFAVLIYPVISMREGLTHPGTRHELLGDSPSGEDILFYSSEKQVSPRTPPVFLAHARDDTVVPPENSALFAARMKELGRPCVYLELESGGHGLNGYKGPSWEKWQHDAAAWIKQL